eukprot:m.36660 g.36660  ORF g.36660 m.36660 type:complete len:184 (-) comp6689_c1_seq3:7-558(-)
MERPMQQGSDVNEEGNEAHEPSLSLQGDALEAMKEFERAHNIQEEDLIYCYDEDEYKLSIAGEQWKSDPKYFKHTKISALALLKMVMHANSGGNLEIMGMLQGKVEGDTIIIMDVFALPVKGTETRVNAGDQEYAFMFEYVGMMKDVCLFNISNPYTYMAYTYTTYNSDNCFLVRLILIFIDC